MTHRPFKLKLRFRGKIYARSATHALQRLFELTEEAVRRDFASFVPIIPALKKRITKAKGGMTKGLWSRKATRDEIAVELVWVNKARGGWKSGEVIISKPSPAPEVKITRRREGKRTVYRDARGRFRSKADWGSQVRGRRRK